MSSSKKQLKNAAREAQREAAKAKTAASDAAAELTVAKLQLATKTERTQALETALHAVALDQAAAPPPAPPAPPPPAPLPAAPLSARLAELQKRPGLELVAATFAAENAKAIRAGIDARNAHAAALDAPPVAPPVTASPPAAPAPPPAAPAPKTYRQLHAELRERDPYSAAAFILQHQHHLDAAVPQ